MGPGSTQAQAKKDEPTFMMAAGQFGFDKKPKNEQDAMLQVSAYCTTTLRAIGKPDLAGSLEYISEKAKTDEEAKKVALAYVSLCIQLIQSHNVRSGQSDAQNGFLKGDVVAERAYMGQIKLPRSNSSTHTEWELLLAQDLLHVTKKYDAFVAAANRYDEAFSQYWKDPFIQKNKETLEAAAVAFNTASAEYSVALSGAKSASAYRKAFVRTKYELEQYIKRGEELVALVDKYGIGSNSEEEERKKAIYGYIGKCQMELMSLGGTFSKLSASKMFVKKNGEYVPNSEFVLGIPSHSFTNYPSLPISDGDSLFPHLDRLASLLLFKDTDQRNLFYQALDIICWKELMVEAKKTRDDALWKRAYAAAEAVMLPFSTFDSYGATLKNWEVWSKEKKEHVRANKFMNNGEENFGIVSRYADALKFLREYNKGGNWDEVKIEHNGGKKTVTVESIIKEFDGAQTDLMSAFSRNYQIKVLGKKVTSESMEMFVDVGMGVVGMVGGVLTITGLGTVPGAWMVGVSSAYFIGRGAAGFYLSAKEGDTKGMLFSGLMVVAGSTGFAGAGLKIAGTVLSPTLRFTMGAVGGTSGVLLGGALVYEAGKITSEGLEYGFNAARTRELATTLAFLTFAITTAAVAKNTAAARQRQLVAEMNAARLGAVPKPVPQEVVPKPVVPKAEPVPKPVEAESGAALPKPKPKPVKSNPVGERVASSLENAVDVLFGVNERPGEVVLAGGLGGVEGVFKYLARAIQKTWPKVKELTKAKEIIDTVGEAKPDGNYSGLRGRLRSLLERIDSAETDIFSRSKNKLAKEISGQVKKVQGNIAAIEAALNEPVKAGERPLSREKVLELKGKKEELKIELKKLKDQLKDVKAGLDPVLEKQLADLDIFRTKVDQVKRALDAVADARIPGEMGRPQPVPGPFGYRSQYMVKFLNQLTSALDDVLASLQQMEKLLSGANLRDMSTLETLTKRLGDAQNNIESNLGALDKLFGEIPGFPSKYYRGLPWYQKIPVCTGLLAVVASGGYITLTWWNSPPKPKERENAQNQGAAQVPAQPVQQQTNFDTFIGTAKKTKFWESDMEAVLRSRLKPDCSESEFNKAYQDLLREKGKYPKSK